VEAQAEVFACMKNSDSTLVCNFARDEQVPQFVTYNWVSFFFSGFVVAKVPFALTMRFRQMLQRGVDLQGLDVTYISSLSWCAYAPHRAHSRRFLPSLNPRP